MNDMDEIDSNSQDRIIARHAVRPGYQLIGAREVGLPVYYLRLRSVVMAHKALPPISEFVLKSIDSSVRVEDELAGISGLGEAVVRRALVDLRTSEEIDLVAPAGGQLQEWSLTVKGKATLALAERVTPEEVTLPVYFDGLLRAPVKHETASLLRARDLRDFDAQQIAPIPPHPPIADEITIPDVNAILRATIRPGRTKRELLIIKSILKSDLLFQPALMLVFQSLTGSEIQVGFVIDGAASPAHDRAFAVGDGPHAAGILQNAGRRTAEQIAEELLQPDMMPDVELLRQAERLQQQSRERRAASERRDEPSGDLKNDEPRFVSPKVADNAEELAASKSSANEAEEKLAQLPVALLEMYEHRDILEKAIRESRTRLMINSPWVTSRAVNQFFLRELERRLRDGLNVYIAYGLEKEKKHSGEADHHAINALRTLSRSYPRQFRFTWLGDTHAKVLISDSSFMVVTSFNWLSFKGDPDRTFRDERGLLVRDPGAIDEMFKRILKRMEEADQRS